MTWDSSAITIITLLPILGALVILLVPRDRERMVRGLGILFTGAALVLSVAMAIGFDYGTDGLQYELDVNWISAIGARYHVGIDGISMPLYVLTFLLSFLCAVYTWRFVPDPGRTKVFLALMLLLETGMAGTFIAFDLILFFVFWEMVLVPMYFLIGIWGSANREYAAIKFFLYTLFGSVFMLLGFLAMYFNGPEPRTFDLVTLTQFGSQGGYAHGFQLVVFGAVALGFAIKVPMWPFHTWLPDAHTEAPTIGSVLLAGIMLKMGTYGFVRIALPVLPEGAQAYAPWIGVLGAIAIVYGALACLAQRDLKRLIAYSSVGHMGFVMLGIATLTPVGINGALYANVAHGLITGLLFFLAGAIKDRHHTAVLDDLGGGLYERTPRLGGLLAFAAVASLGLPGLAGFWGEMLTLLGAFDPDPALHRGYYLVLMAVAGVGLVLTTVYLVTLVRRVSQGQSSKRWREAVLLGDASRLELAAWTPLVLLVLVLGLWPKLLLDVTDPVVRQVLGG